MDDRGPTVWFLRPPGVTWLGMAANVLLAAGKIAAGLVCHSQTILADGLHSGSDMITDAAVLAGLRVSARPPDGWHHYGHRRANTLAALFVAVVLLGAGAWIVWNAVATLRHPAEPVRPAVPLALAVLSVVVKELLYRLTRLVGRRTGNVALKANAWHHRTDAFSSLAAAAGLAGAAFGGPEWRFLDPVTAMVLAAFLVAVAAKLMFHSASELMDGAPGRRTLAGIEAAVARTPGVRSYHAFRARRVGGQVAMDIHVEVDPALTVREGHDIATEVRNKVMEADRSVVEVIVHVEPAPDAPSPR